MASERIELETKPDKCPHCGSAPVAEILYGFPNFNDELEQKLNANEIVLGGCCISGDDPEWQCPQCNLYIFRKPVGTVDLGKE